ncbi:hypothetical protein [Yersinia pseudotuberculosis]|uniref:hypothetical protein n=1 Tax=Yersinia pseudotuberculosis TaxID=633 RepID=UPI00215986BB|nr:hypothetical protein [Yersinia pseudotuberculosis]
MRRAARSTEGGAWSASDMYTRQVMESIFSLFSETEGHLAEMKFIDSAGEDYRFILRLEVPPILERQH